MTGKSDRAIGWERLLEPEEACHRTTCIPHETGSAELLQANHLNNNENVPSLEVSPPIATLLHVQKVQLGPVQLCIKPLRSSGTGGPRSLTPGKGSKLIAVASTIATRESALNKNKKLQELARQTAESA